MICGAFFTFTKAGLSVSEWEQIEEQNSAAAFDVSLRLKQNQQVEINSYEDLAFVLTSEADDSGFYFTEDISLQKKVDGVWCFLSDGHRFDKSKDSAYDPCILAPENKATILVSLEKLLPWQLREVGEYRLCLPVYKDEDENMQAHNIYAEFWFVN